MRVNKVVNISGDSFDTAVLLSFEDGAVAFTDGYCSVRFLDVDLNALARWVLDELDMSYDEDDFPVDD